MSSQGIGNMYPQTEDENLQIKEIMRQKDLLHKLQMEKEAIKRQLEANDRIMHQRMQHVLEEKRQIEYKVHFACVRIQSFVRMK